MRRLKNCYIDKLLKDEKGTTFRDTVMITIFINGNFVVKKKNIFEYMTNDSVLNTFIGFVKIIQKYISRVGDEDIRIFMRFWRDNKNIMTKEAFSIVITGLDAFINQLFEELLESNPKDTQGITLGHIKKFYPAMCKNKINDMGNEDFELKEDEVFEDIVSKTFEEQDKNNDNFIDIFSWKNTKNLLNIDYEVNDIKTIEDIDKLKLEKMKLYKKVCKTDEEKKLIESEEKKPFFLPVEDYIINPKCFFWECFGYYRFPWYDSNLFESKANKFVEMLKEENDLERPVEESMELLKLRKFSKRVDWKTLNEKEEEEIRDRAEQTRLKSEGKNMRKRKREEEYDFFSSKEVKRRKYSIVNAPQRIIPSQILDLGNDQKYKEPLEMLKGINEKEEKLCSDKVELQNRKNKIFNDFLNCSGIRPELPRAVSAIINNFGKSREKFKLLVSDVKKGILGNFIEMTIRNFRTFFNLENTLHQIIVMFNGRESNFCEIDPMKLHIEIIGGPGTGKSYTVFIFYGCSINGTVVFNSIVESAKSGVAILRNEDNWAVKIDVDLGPYLTWDPKKMPIDLYAKMKQYGTVLTEGWTWYKFLTWDQSNGKNTIENRKAVRTAVENKGCNIQCTNVPISHPEIKDREHKVYVETDEKRQSVILSKISEILFKGSEVNNIMQDIIRNYMKEIQSDTGLYHIYCSTKAAPTMPNIISGLLILNFLLENMADVCTFFEWSPRKIVRVIHSTISFKSDVVKTQLTCLENSKYYGVPFINDPAEFCFEFGKRMMISYEVITSLSLMLPEFIDDNIIEMIDVIKKKIFMIETDLSTRESIVDYFESVILSQGNASKNYPLNFQKTTADEAKKKIRGRANNDSNDPNNTNWQGTVDYSTNKQEFIDPTNIMFTTDKTTEQFASEIAKHMKNKPCLQVVIDLLEKMKLMHVKRTVPLVPIESKCSEIDIYQQKGEFEKLLKTYEEAENEELEGEPNNLEEEQQQQQPNSKWKKKAKKKSKKNEFTGEKPVLFHKFIGGKNYYLFPVEIFNIQQKSGYEILKAAIKKLAFKNQGVMNSPFIKDRKSYYTTIVKVPSMEVETIDITPDDKTSPEKFVISNPKELSKKDRLFYNIVIKSFAETLKKKQISNENNNQEFYENLINKNKLEIDKSIETYGIDHQKKYYNMTDEEIGEIYNEEEKLLKKEILLNGKDKSYSGLINNYNDSVMDTKQSVQEELKNIVDDNNDDSDNEGGDNNKQKKKNK